MRRYRPPARPTLTNHLHAALLYGGSGSSCMTIGHVAGLAGRHYTKATLHKAVTVAARVEPELIDALIIAALIFPEAALAYRKAHTADVARIALCAQGWAWRRTHGRT